ncbi:histidine kinase [Actinomadura mexicana]|uniref:Two-component system, NarL family, sensor histidine kinase DesK n=1 Tax=Actinomadura mexicana TaxID=134959 RepID=A0A239G0U1_9ACTN|nr:histidine kinase [Actinomadura mexicana]SNS62605.1 two-component system, NarL family, sensor histidine kinase DesK [Actinomadura mexicana]
MQPRIPRPTVIAAIIVGMTVLTLAGFLLPALWYEFVDRRDAGRLIPALLGTGAAFALYARLLWQNLMRRTAPAHRLGLAAIAAICWVLPPLLDTGQGWGNALLVPAGLIAVVLPVREAIAVTAAVTVLTPVYGVLLGLPALTVLYEVTGVPLGAFSGYVTVWLFHVVQELREARAELARSAVGEERLRFARDLHDVLGHSLQAVALRAEVAERFVERDDGRVRKELTEIQTMARDAVRDVREVVRGYRATSLRTELDGMSAVLRAAGIRCERPEVSPELPAHVHEPLGWVAREAATNLLRHSSATWCEITLRAGRDRVRLEIVNDGAARRAAGDAGSGLAGLAERITAAGGVFHAGPAGDGTFRVTAAVPAKGDA